MLLLRAMPASPRRISPPWAPPPPTAVRPVNCVFGCGGVRMGIVLLLLMMVSTRILARARFKKKAYRRRQRRLGEEPAVARLA